MDNRTDHFRLLSIVMFKSTSTKGSNIRYSREDSVDFVNGLSSILAWLRKKSTSQTFSSTKQHILSEDTKKTIVKM